MTNEEFKEVLGFDKTHSRDYDGLRVAIKTYMTQNGISNRTQAGNEKWKTMGPLLLAPHSTGVSG